MKKKSLFRTFGWLFLGLFVISFLFVWNNPSQSGQKVGFSEFIRQADGGKIVSVTITGNNISGQTASGGRFQTYAPNQYEGLVNQLIQKGIAVNAEEETVSPWISMLFMWGPILLIVVFWLFFINRMRGGEKNMTSFGKSGVKLAQSEKKVTFKDVAGVEEAKSELQETVEFLKDPQKFQKLGGRLPKGVLLAGPPGSGKTLLAKAVAGEAAVPFFFISGSDFVEMFVGVGASRVRDLFEQGKKNAPCIIFIDEIDAVGRHRGAGIGGGHDEREQTLNQLLVEMDGFEANEGVILIAATNRPDVLDPALLRPGRFDRTVVVDRPDVKGRENILKIHAKKVPLAEGTNLFDIAKGTPGLCGADLANLVNEAALNAARHNRQAIDRQDLEFAKDKIIMGTERKSLVISDEEKRTTAVHEAGHALVSLFVPKADPLHKVTVIPRGMALGLTQQLPAEDRHNYSREYLESQLAILMGGRCAEEIILGQQTTGAKNDIERATEIAYQMVCEWGMSELGPLNFVASKSENPFLGKQLTEKSYNCSEATAQQIDQAIKSLVDKAYKTAGTAVAERKEVVERLAATLIEREVLEGEEIRKIVGI
ncbi:MAG: cell division protein FtsH [Candidatus Yanofskybacteria bacterium RIFCSPLOWO2_02_FULL_43_10]|uniref:ATP-dependent zinc metalloprotease FtsH n=1 Tax=Candidatus Yanofskybacteria bacterium RIFCSPLOWO2_12_FULL_43_11b TaxID=1802710 RepID=A0A1F8H6Z3_9BACT|nr:MAG: cell division protein FtsH [Candidatus Yanofskybacteria bacterium RIFCSPHIGHO2_01_FULL_43_32]OGN11545.1 MAG: cell division protein FtsH [Candidatus Yanofskybacteria bacterium RIFCSPHIGHO2_02_FULL_43_12]OGN17430.1 MAG: cell division protein FtsH [Candidatus Yanofskybacteria bacterium RIFCSPHIGHO2_12_FULL_43_11]OGN24882.1 MAG: cell division protein FtsH [Candidatus Yanofskybacteria bacterium RIFCSPLOWO2_01_FULL_43_46]OGN30268.1 MAG: cell division protein FtsH [Candidatus Yanofskybacteria 